MSNASSGFLVKVDTLTLVKALSITMIVFSHAMIKLWFFGGLHGLILVTGISMAMFAFNAATAETIQAFKRYTLKLVIPGLIFALICFLVKWEFSWREILLIQNWFTKNMITTGPIGYIMMIAQLMLSLGILFWIFNLTPKIKQAPVLTTVSMLIIAVAICVTSHQFWYTALLNDNLPHLLAWNLILGWVFWALLIRGERTRLNQLIMTAILLACVNAVLLYGGTNNGGPRAFWFSILGLILIWRQYVLLPRPVAHIIGIIGQATFYIFLLHSLCFAVIIHPGEWLGLSYARNPALLFTVGMIVPTLIWVAIRSMTITWRRMQRQNMTGAAPAR